MGMNLHLMPFWCQSGDVMPGVVVTSVQSLDRPTAGCSHVPYLPPRVRMVDRLEST
jgi:hypothetical protein